jgi:putative phosphoesterase
MLIGIMSDSHGDARITARAVTLLESRGARVLFHCGDICELNVLDELAGRDAVFVWGNCDRPTATARRYVESIGLPWPRPPVTRKIAGKRIAVWHGHEPEFEALGRSSIPRRVHVTGDVGVKCDYVFYGHTHKYADERVNGCRFINPGALYRAAVHSVALLDCQADELTFLQVETGEALT